jgi:hypothetical protein
MHLRGRDERRLRYLPATVSLLINGHKHGMPQLIVDGLTEVAFARGIFHQDGPNIEELSSHTGTGTDHA